jgi:hypothetical protein
MIKVPHLPRVNAAASSILAPRASTAQWLQYATMAAENAATLDAQSSAGP